VLELERPLCRAGVSWTLEQGGALVLAHERESLTATARRGCGRRASGGASSASWTPPSAAGSAGRSAGGSA
jgi:hypothetical protein